MTELRLQILPQMVSLQVKKFGRSFKTPKGTSGFLPRMRVYIKYDGNKFTNFTEADGVQSNAIQSIYEDASGTIWLGGYLGLSRLKDNRFIHVTESGPWKD